MYTVQEQSSNKALEYFFLSWFFEWGEFYHLYPPVRQFIIRI